MQVLPSIKLLNYNQYQKYKFRIMISQQQLSLYSTYGLLQDLGYISISVAISFVSQAKKNIIKRDFIMTHVYLTKAEIILARMQSKFNNIIKFRLESEISQQ